MTIGFLIQRNIYYKFFGTVIDQALKKGHKVFCYHDYSQTKSGQKAYQFPHLRAVPRFRFGLVQPLSFANDEELLDLIKKHKIEVLVSLNFPPYSLNLQKKTKLLNIKWIALQQGLDSLVWADLSSEPDLSLYYSRAWLDFSLAYLEKQKLTFNQEIIEKKTCFSGFPEIDQIKLVNPYEIKKRWGIPEEQKVLLFLPFTFGSTNDRFWARFIYGNDLSFLKPLFGIFSFKRKFFQQIFKGENDLMFCRLLKDFCQRNDVFLLVKSRRKDLVKPYLSKLADKVLYDEQEYPSTIIECFAVANLCLNFLSTAVLESVALGCPNISVLPSNGYKDIQNPLWELLLNKYRDIFDFKGVSQLISLRDVFLLLKEKNLNDFTLNKQAQEEYLKKYIGSKDPSKKAIDAIEKLAMKQSRT